MHIRFKYLGLLAVSLLALSCSSDEVEPTTGAISGSVLPIRAANVVHLIKGTDTIKTTTKPDGTYEITELQPGKYEISAKPNYGFAVPKPGPIVINAGYTTLAYPIRVPGEAVTGSFSVTLQDSVYTGSPAVDLFSTPGFSVSAGPYLFRFKMPKISGTGIYTPATHKELQLEVLHDEKTWVANSSQGNLELTITHYESLTKRGDATFTFTAVNPTEAPIAGTNGQLHFLRLRK